MTEEETHFERSAEGFSASTLDRSATARHKLQNYYKNILDSTIERKSRFDFKITKAFGFGTKVSGDNE